MGGHDSLQNRSYVMRNEGFDRDMFGFVVALVGMAGCVVVSGLWSCLG